jgi:hypothetical protein
MNNEPTIQCDVALEALQSRLDGSAQPADPVIARHVRQCAECRSRFAAADMLLSVYSQRVPADLTVRLRSAVYADARRRTYRRVFVSAIGIAAAILIAVWLAVPNAEKRDDIVVAAKVPSIEKRLVGAKTAIWEWGGRTVSALGVPDFSEPRIDTRGIGQAIEPAAAALSDAGKGFVDGVSPLTSSAKRAANRFWHEIPKN